MNAYRDLDLGSKGATGIVNFYPLSPETGNFANFTQYIIDNKTLILPITSSNGKTTKYDYPNIDFYIVIRSLENDDFGKNIY
jgi:hypothetical protein